MSPSMDKEVLCGTWWRIHTLRLEEHLRKVGDERQASTFHRWAESSLCGDLVHQTDINALFAMNSELIRMGANSGPDGWVMV